MRTAIAALSFEMLATDRCRLAGILDAGTARWALQRGEVEFLNCTGALQVDLSGITRADSAGLAVLLAWVGAVRRRGGTVAFQSVPAGLQAIATLCGVDGMLGLGT
jgi:phospholipid transport system transporter-binding protein